MPYQIPHSATPADHAAGYNSNTRQVAKTYLPERRLQRSKAMLTRNGGEITGKPAYTAATRSASSHPQATAPTRRPDKSPPLQSTACNRFPSNNFRSYLTLLSKFFSSFDHSTCSLSVSRRYLALDGIYHPLWAAISNNPTLRIRNVQQRAPGRLRGSHPLRRPIPRDLCRSACLNPHL